MRRHFTSVFEQRTSTGYHRPGSVTPGGLELIGEPFHIRNENGDRIRHGVFRCRCGGAYLTEMSPAFSGKRKSCGCLNQQRHRDNAASIGERVDRLVMVGMPFRYDGTMHAVYLCDCGSHVVRSVKYVRNRRRVGTASCGCKLASANNRSRERLYRTWSHMNFRCTNPKEKAWNIYGGKGIRVCQEWATDYEQFRKWAYSSGYADNLSIDRIDSDGDYEPGNCRWVTLSDNSKHANWTTRQKRLKQQHELDVLRASVMFLLQEVAGAVA